jgi:putative transcriptional regulator
VSESLSGQLLIASPSMSDDFRRSVVLVVEHNPEGAFGLVLNQPSDSTVGEVSPELAELVGPEHLIYVGGPVQPGAVTAIGEHRDPTGATKLIVGAVGMVDLDAPPELTRLRIFAGYAGWGPGQLESELEEDAWLIEDASPEDAFREDDLWSVTLARRGGEYALLATMPEDPSLN